MRRTFPPKRVPIALFGGFQVREATGGFPVKRSWTRLAVLAVLVVAGVVLSGPSGGDDRGPHGTLALRRYLASMGGTVRNADTPPDAPAVFVLLKDLRDAKQAGDLVSWA